MIIKGSGNVGIGTTSPSSTLHISKDQADMAANNPLVLLQTTGTATNTKGSILHLHSTRNNGTDDTDLFKVSGAAGDYLSVRNTGNVGVGTVSPTAKLNIDVAGNNANGLLLNQSSGYPSVGESLLKVSTVYTGARNLIDFGSGGNTHFSILSDGHINIGQSSTLHIDTNDRAGFGTTTPKGLVDISSTGDAVLTDSDNYPLKITNSSWGGNQVTGIEFWNGGSKLVPTSRIITQMAGSGADGENLLLQTQSSSATNPNPNQPTTKMTIENDGNVGIGTTSPGNKLTIAGGDLQIASNESRLLFGADGSERMYFKPSSITGNQQDLTLYLGDDPANGNGERFIIKTWHPTTENQNNDDFIFDLGRTSGKRFFQINAGDAYLGVGSGDVGIGTTSPSQKLHIVGNLRVQGSTDCILGNGSGATSCTSDRRLKDQVRPINHALEKIKSVRGVDFVWNNLARSPGRHDIGVIAQDIQKAFPTAVIENDEGYLSVDYAVLVAPLIESVKELDENMRMFKTMQDGILNDHSRKIANLESLNRELREDYLEIKSENELIKEQLQEMKAFLCMKNNHSNFCKR